VYTARGSRWRSDLLLVRVRGMAEPLVNDLRELIATRVPSMPIDWVQTLAQMSEGMNRESIQGAALAAAGGLVALLLTSLGLYGVVSLAVQQRTREIGIRIAVGANPAGVTRMFLQSGVRLAGIALLIGLPVTVVGFRLGQAQGVINEGANFWLVGLGISVVLLAVSCAATWAPARRASRVDPAIALRAE
jgi:ABC-type antimicrobial peptide transport system permease subunit